MTDHSGQNRASGEPYLVHPLEVALILAIDYTPLGHALFGTAPIGYQAWLVTVPFVAAMLALDEARKAFVRRREGSA